MRAVWDTLVQVFIVTVVVDFQPPPLHYSPYYLQHCLFISSEVTSFHSEP